MGEQIKSLGKIFKVVVHRGATSSVRRWVNDTPNKLPKGEKGTWNINQDVQGKGDLKVATKLAWRTTSMGEKWLGSMPQFFVLPLFSSFGLTIESIKGIWNVSYLVSLWKVVFLFPSKDYLFFQFFKKYYNFLNLHVFSM
jgi:hypothetical protein